MQSRDLDGLVNSTSDPAFALDGLGRITAWNGAAQTLFGLTARQAIGKRCDQVVQGTGENGVVCSADCAIQQAVRSGETVGNFDMHVRTTDGLRRCNVSVLTAAGDDCATRYSIHIVHVLEKGRRLEHLVRNLMEAGRELLAEQADAAIVPSRTPALEMQLSGRELEILELLAKGVRTKVIGEQLHVSVTTVRNHVQHILRKLGAHTRLEAIGRAKDAGLID